MAERRKSTRRPTGVYEPKSSPRIGAFVYGLCAMAVIGGFLFGYDTGIVSGAMLYLPKNEGMLPMSSLWKELIVSLTPGMAVVGALTAGPISDRFGRRPVIIMSSIVFTVGGILCAAAPEKVTLLVGRILLGVGVGFASMTVPIYVGETSPANIRGRLVTAFQLMITFGLLAANLFAGAFSYANPINVGWRLMFALAALPSIVQFFGFLFLPESPRYLFGRGKMDEARQVLNKVYGGNAEWVIYEMEEIRAADIEEKKAKEIVGDKFVLLRMLETPHVRKAMIIGCCLQLFQQFGGVNTIVYYTSHIITAAGVENDHVTIWISLAISSVNFFCTFIPITLIEKFGRRVLLLTSVCGVIVAITLMATSFILINKDSPPVTSWKNESFNTTVENSQHCQDMGNCDFCVTSSHCGYCYETFDDKKGFCLPLDPEAPDYSLTGYCSDGFNSSVYNWESDFCETKFTIMPVVFMVLYMGFFSIGFAPLPWVLNAEFYPLWARSTGCALSTAANWIANLIISLTFLTLSEAVTKYGAFFIYAGITVVAFIFIFIFVPETKGLPIEQVELLFMSESDRVKIAKAASARLTIDSQETEHKKAVESAKEGDNSKKANGIDNAAFVSADESTKLP
uniref:Major facilitator superfamily (MFS) profile domain-containing protein n=2 Tax=Parascaris univalens TaxID=6257 RepID=A0A915BDF2_PARUN